MVFINVNISFDIFHLVSMDIYFRNRQIYSSIFFVQVYFRLLILCCVLKLKIHFNTNQALLIPLEVLCAKNVGKDIYFFVHPHP